MKIKLYGDRLFKKNWIELSWRIFGYCAALGAIGFMMLICLLYLLPLFR